MIYNIFYRLKRALKSQPPQWVFLVLWVVRQGLVPLRKPGKPNTQALSKINRFKKEVKNGNPF